LALVVGCGGGGDETAPPDTSAATIPRDSRGAPGEHTYVFWGDNHTHTRYSVDAWAIMHGSLDIQLDSDPFESCLFAWQCAGLDFFVNSEHGEFLSDDAWDEVRRQVLDCQKLVDGAKAEFAAYQGYEWTQTPNLVGLPDWRRFGHKILHFLNLEDPGDSEEAKATRGFTLPRPIAATDLSLKPLGLEHPDFFYDLLKEWNVPANTSQAPIDEYLEVATYPPCSESADPRACRAYAVRPYDLFKQLDAWREADPEKRQVVVGGHGTSWGLGGYAFWSRDYRQSEYAPYRRDPATGKETGYETYVELYSKHGNSEQYVELPSDYVRYESGHIAEARKPGVGIDVTKATDEWCSPFDDDKSDDADCGCRPRKPGERYLPCCWRCYEWVVDHFCPKHPLQCEDQKDQALTQGPGICEALLFADVDLPSLDWAECSQCPSSGCHDCDAPVSGAPKPMCWKPAYAYAAVGSVQAGLAQRLDPGCESYDGGKCEFGACDCKGTGSPPGTPAQPDPNKQYFEWGFIGATDTHHVKPGSVQQTKEFAEIFEGTAYALGKVVLQNGKFSSTTQNRSYWYPGGIAAVHLPIEHPKDPAELRRQVFDAFKRREIYASSGPRIKLWFQLTNASDGLDKPMGSSVRGVAGKPAFRVRAVGAPRDRGDPASREAKLGATVEACAHVAATEGAAFVEATCRGTCFAPDPADRLAVERIEVVRIRRQLADEGIDTLIDDPWQIHDCDPSTATSDEGCSWSFDDEEYAASQPVVYYVRAIQEKTPSVNADTVRCSKYDADGACRESKPCQQGPLDDCTAATHERAWSSPIYLYPPE
jgi:hypothetical protein